MTELVVHPLTRRQLDSLAARPAQAILLVGPAGSGKQSLALSLSETILRLAPGALDKYPYKLVISPGDSKSIGIDEVRELERFMSLKVPGRNGYNRAVIVENAHYMTAEAQNALLKTLEEPPAGTLIILTASNGQALLPTVRSRVQPVVIKPPDKAAAEAYFRAQDFDGRAINQAYAISGGLPGLMQALLATADHPLVLATRQARQLLSQPVYERLLMVDELARQRSLAADTAFILQQMARISLQTASDESAAKWQAVLSAAYEASEALAANAQPKLVLTKLMLSL